MKANDIYDLSKKCIFVFELKEKTGDKRILECLKKLEGLYPEKLTGNDIYLLPDHKKKSWICFVKPEFGENKICVELFVLNHFKSFSGTVCVSLSETCFEQIEIDRGKIKSIRFSKNLPDFELCFISKEQIVKAHRKNDIPSVGNERFFKKLGLLCVLVFCVLLLGFFVSEKIVKNYKERSSKLNEEILNREVEVKKKKENENQCLELEALFRKECEKGFLDIYECFCIIYDCVVNKSLIQNVNIEKEKFSIDLISKDGVLVLGNFENCRRIKNVFMNKLSGNVDGEIVNFTGTFYKNMNFTGEELDLEEKISFYKENLEKIEKQKQKLKEKSYSEYADMILRILGKNTCEKKYLQYKNENKVAVLECLFDTTSENFLKLLKQIQDSYSEQIFIQRIKVRNDFDNNKLQILCSFWTGIEFIEKEEDFFYETNAKTALPFEIKNIFENQIIVSKIEKQEKNKTENEAVLKGNNIAYLGKSSAAGIEKLIFKNQEFNNLYLLPVEETVFQKTENCCQILENDTFLVRINEKVYEVKK